MYTRLCWAYSISKIGWERGKFICNCIWAGIISPGTYVSSLYTHIQISESLNTRFYNVSYDQ